MSNVEVYLVVEGQTEQTFVRDLLAPSMASNGIYITAALVGTPGHKGGDVRFERVQKDIINFLKQCSDTYVSTMLDYFRIDPSWPGCEKIRQNLNAGIKLTADQKAKIIEAETREKIGELQPNLNSDDRFIPYIGMHEFEALLFSDAQKLAAVTNIDSKNISEILNQYENPEEINDDPKNAPSYRLRGLKLGYRKVAMGKEIAVAVGIAAMREKCPHFNQWLTHLEKLNAS